MAEKAKKSDKNIDTVDNPIINSQEAVKKMIAEAKKKGYITYDALNEALPQDQMSSEQIEAKHTAKSSLQIVPSPQKELPSQSNPPEGKRHEPSSSVASWSYVQASTSVQP